MQKLKVLDLFSGIGGFSLGLERTGYFETVAFCEIEPFCQKVLAKHWPDVPIHTDIRELSAEDVGPVDFICGGYPCQPFSHAGKRQGAEDDRHLWPEFARLIKELRPPWVIGENVAGHISMGLDEVLSDLEGEGYTARPLVIPACAVDAPHRRDRVWTIAYTKRPRSRGDNSGSNRWGAETQCENIQQENRQTYTGDAGALCQTLADAERQRGRSGDAKREDAGNAWEPPRCSGDDTRGVGFWLPEPNVGRVANGVPSRVDRLRSLGNAVVPQIPELIGYAIAEAEGLTNDR